MSKRHFSILLLIAVVVAVAVFLIPSRTGQESEQEHGLFLPELADAVNDISMVRISAKGGAEVVTMERSDSAWIVSESSGYPADWSVLRPLLADLSQAEVVEEKTSNPEYYHRLGVEDPDTEDAVSKLIEFPGNENLPGVIVGNSAQGRDGQYLRLQGEARSVLVDRDITLPLNINGWLARDIIDVPDSDVVSVQITHPDGEVVAIERESTDESDFAHADPVTTCCSSTKMVIRYGHPHGIRVKAPTEWEGESVGNCEGVERGAHRGRIGVGGATIG